MFRDYIVTVTPKITTYFGNSVDGQYTTEVVAKTAAEALKKARRERRDNEGRFATPCTYRAKLSKETD